MLDITDIHSYINAIPEEGYTYGDVGMALTVGEFRGLPYTFLRFMLRVFWGEVLNTTMGRREWGSYKGESSITVESLYGINVSYIRYTFNRNDHTISTIKKIDTEVYDRYLDEYIRLTIEHLGRYKEEWKRFPGRKEQLIKQTFQRLYVTHREVNNLKDNEKSKVIIRERIYKYLEVYGDKYGKIDLNTGILYTNK